jgi:nickel/cobalt transporter (NicO) family protein
VDLSAFASVLVAGFAVAFLHAATPTHWLPFVLVGRAQGWSSGRTLGVTAVAGFGHAMFTAVLGLVLTGAGVLIGERLGDVFPRLVAVGLIALGLYYLVRYALRPPHHETPSPRRYASDAAAIAGLVALLTFTPSEAVLPVYLANLENGWKGFLMLTTALTLATTGGMVTFTALFIAGAHYELVLVGLGLCAIGVLVALEA